MIINCKFQLILIFSYCLGCTTGSTHVEQQLKEIKEPQVTQDKKVSKLAAHTYANTKPRLDADQSTFRVYKGVKTFDFSKQKNVLVTGGKGSELYIAKNY